MGKTGKTTTQIGMQAYGGMQTELRRMSREDADRYAQPGTPAHDRHLARVREAETRRDYRERAIKAFDKDEPRFGSFVGLDESAVTRRNETQAAWRRKREAFIAELNRTHPPIKY